MKTILIPLDGSALARHALAPGLRLASRHRARVVLASIVADLPPVPLATGEGEMVARWFADEERRANIYLQEVREEALRDHPGLAIDLHVEVGPVVRSLATAAESAGADLIALTTHGRGAWQRAWLGSVADALLRDSRRPLLLLREGESSASLFREEGSPVHVLVPMDGSPEAENILGALTSLLPGGGGRVTLLTVVGTPFPLASSYLPHADRDAVAAEEQRERARRRLREIAARWNPAGVDVEVEAVVSDDVARSILARAKSDGIDLLALSTRGRGGVGRLLLGSVADKLIRATELPILAVRRKQ